MSSSLPPRNEIVGFKFPENTNVTMTTREVSLFLAELGEIRQLLGTIGTRISTLENSVSQCQARCTDERKRRLSWVHWGGSVLAALLPGALVYYLQRK